MAWFRSWITDWHTGVVFLAAVIVGLVMAVVVVSGVNTHDAITARNQTAQLAARRVDQLNARITDLVNQAQVNGARIGELTGEIAALSEQVRQLGGRPVATAAIPTSPTTSTTAPRPATTTTQPQSTTTTTTPRTCVLIVCR